MGRVYYNKLIRDKIPEKIEKNREKYEVREISDDQEYEQELLKKVLEESSALSRARSREEFLEEYVDLKVVLDSLIKVQNYSQSEVDNALNKNLEKKGGFEKRYFMHWSDDSDYKSNETPQGIKK